MNDEFAEDYEEGRVQPTRKQTQRVVQRDSRTTSHGANSKRRRAKRRQAVAGIHKRRDKHWNW